MSDQDGAQPSTKQRRSRKTSTTNEKNGKKAPVLQHPTNVDKEAWKAYWKVQDQPWRTEPEIDTQRQAFLDERRSIIADVEQGIYPFKEIKLNRADVEWLLATFENVHRLADWNDWRQPGPDGLDLRGADLRHVDLSLLPLTRLRGGLKYEEWIHANVEQRSMAVMHMEGINLHWTHLEGAHFYETRLERADLREAHLEGAHFRGAHLEGAQLRGAYLQGANLRNAHVEGSDLKGAFFTSATNLADIRLGNEKFGVASLGGVRWDDVELSVIDWTQIRILGDELQARQQMQDNGEMKTAALRLEEFQATVRANRRLAIALQGQGLNEVAARFAYRAQLLQRKVFWYQRKFGQYLFSLFLDLLAGYGYKPGRSFIAYALVVSLFATIYHLLGLHLAWNEAIVISMTAFHGRGFFPDQFHPGDPQALVAAIEAFVGLLIEVTFIATLTQRLFGK